VARARGRIRALGTNGRLSIGLVNYLIACATLSGGDPTLKRATAWYIPILIMSCKLAYIFSHVVSVVILFGGSRMRDQRAFVIRSLSTRRHLDNLRRDVNPFVLDEINNQLNNNDAHGIPPRIPKMEISVIRHTSHVICCCCSVIFGCKWE
jgi:hypothetical protein